MCGEIKNYTLAVLKIILQSENYRIGKNNKLYMNAVLFP